MKPVMALLNAATVIVSLATVFTSTGFAQAAPGSTPWKLPLSLSERNTVVTFDVDTTWHVVHGVAQKVQGEISSSDPANPLAIQGEIRFPVAAMDTGWDARDDSFYEHIESEKFNHVVFTIASVGGDCAIDTLGVKPCAVKINGSLTIRDVKKDVSLDAMITSSDAGYTVSGKTVLQWASYGMKDPSIIVAKVQPDVTVNFAVTLPADK